MKLFMIVRRNLSLFLNNKMNIFLSFASICVVMGLYLLFLRDFVIDLVTQGGIATEMASQFADRLMLPGLLPVVGATTCFGLIQICVSDSERGIRRDYYTSPIRPSLLMLGYWIAATIVSFFFSFLALLGEQLFFGLHYDAPIGTVHLLNMTMILIVSSMINASIVLLFAKGLKSMATFSTFANLYGTLIGFLSGSYLPYHFYPDWLKKVLFFFPPGQLVCLCRQESLEQLKVGLFPEVGAWEKLYRDMGVILLWNGKEVSQSTQFWLLAVSMAVLLIAICFAVPGFWRRLSRNEK